MLRTRVHADKSKSWDEVSGPSWPETNTSRQLWRVRLSSLASRGHLTVSLDDQPSSANAISGHQPKLKIRFQSFFMLITIQPFDLASS